MTTLVQEGDENIRIIKDLTSFFDTRSRTLTIISIGFNQGGLERILHEQTRSQVHIYESRAQKLQNANTFLSYLSSHDPSLFMKDPWLQTHSVSGASANAFHVYPTIPVNVEGNIRIKGIDETLSCSYINISQMNILKLDMSEANEWILYQILHAGHRPGLVFVKWDRHPDKYSDAMICAGHLQQVGYQLYGQEGSWFSYRFVDDCAYEYCSWARTDCANPLLQAHEELIRTNLLTKLH